MEGLREEGDQLLSEASVIKRLDKNAVGAMAKKKEDTLKVICRRAPKGQGGVKTSSSSPLSTSFRSSKKSSSSRLPWKGSVRRGISWVAIQ